MTSRGSPRCSFAVGGKKPYGQLQAALDAGGGSMALWAYPTAIGPDEDGFRVSEIILELRTISKYWANQTLQVSM